MPRDDSSPSRPLADKHAREGQKHAHQGQEDRHEHRANGAGASAGSKRGRSGYGMESIRPHLRAQLEQHKLMRPTFPPELPEERDRPGRADR